MAGGAQAQATVVTVAEGAPVCRRCATLLFEGFTAAGDGVMALDAVMARLGMCPVGVTPASVPAAPPTSVAAAP
eukprot:4756948-Prymnesium_polylepis.1